MSGRSPSAAMSQAEHTRARPAGSRTHRLGAVVPPILHKRARPAPRRRPASRRRAHHGAANAADRWLTNEPAADTLALPNRFPGGSWAATDRRAASHFSGAIAAG